MLSPSSCHSCVWFQAPLLIFTLTTWPSALSFKGRTSIFMSRGVCPPPTPLIQSTGGRYACYWNAYLLHVRDTVVNREKSQSYRSGVHILSIFIIDSHKAYTNMICWVKNTYYVPWEEQIPLTETRKAYISYYQWVPMILLFQALLCYLPSMIWRFLCR